MQILDKGICLFVFGFFRGFFCGGEGGRTFVDWMDSRQGFVYLFGFISFGSLFVIFCLVKLFENKESFEHSLMGVGLAKLLGTQSASFEWFLILHTFPKRD